MSQLTGKTALITGSVRGIGFGIAKSLAEKGVRIALHDLQQDEASEQSCKVLLKAGAPDVRFFEADMRKPEQIKILMKEVNEWFSIDILVNNAGIQKTDLIPEIDEAVWNDVLAVNLSSSFYTMQAALPIMKQHGYGRVINIASVHGLVASPEKAPYVTAKFGLIGLSKVAALEYAKASDKNKGGVTINCICPGWTETELIEPQILARAAECGGDREAGIASMLADKQPSQRISDPSEIGALTVWLCDPIAHNVTGTAIPVDGGWTAQ